MDLTSGAALVEIATRVSQAGGSVILVLLVWALVTGRLIARMFYDELKEENKELRALLRDSHLVGRNSNQLASQSLTVAEQAAQMAAEIVSRQHALGQQAAQPGPGAKEGTR